MLLGAVIDANVHRSSIYNIKLESHKSVVAQRFSFCEKLIRAEVQFPPKSFFSLFCIPCFDVIPLYLHNTMECSHSIVNQKLPLNLIKHYNVMQLGIQIGKPLQMCPHTFWCGFESRRNLVFFHVFCSIYWVCIQCFY